MVRSRFSLLITVFFFGLTGPADAIADDTRETQSHERRANNRIITLPSKLEPTLEPTLHTYYGR